MKKGKRLTKKKLHEAIAEVNLRAAALNYANNPIHGSAEDLQLMIAAMQYSRVILWGNTE